MYSPVCVSTRAELSNVDFNVYPSVYCSEAGVEKFFDWRVGNYASKVSADSMKGIVVGSNLTPASNGAWVSAKYSDYDSRAFGGAGTAAILAIETVGGGVYHVGGGVPQPILPENYTGTVVQYDGPHTPVNFGKGDNHGVGKITWKSQHAANHIGASLSTFHIETEVLGSGRNGPQQTDVGLSMSHSKKNFLTTTTPGEIDGLYIIMQQGGPVPTGFNGGSDHAGILIDTSSFGNCGHGFAIEAATRNYDSSGNLIVQVQTQMGGIETNWLAFNGDGSLNGNPLGVRYTYGFLASVETGTGDVAYLVEGSAKWTSAFRINAVQSTAVFDILNTGEFWQGSGSNRIKHKHNAGAVNITDASDTVFASFSAASGVIAGDFNGANALVMKGGASGGYTRLAPAGIDPNIDMQLVGKGSGYVMVGRSTSAVGFYGSGGITKQTGVPVTAAGIHAALVALNLIAA